LHLTYNNSFDDNYRGLPEHAYSIQNIAYEGLSHYKLPGEWYGVGSISNIMDTLTNKFAPVDDFRVYVVQDGNIIME